MIDSPISSSQVSQAWDYWYPLIYGYFYRRVDVREDVEDLTANTLAALFIKEDVQNPKAFVWQTAKNQLYKYISAKSQLPKTVDFQEEIVEHFVTDRGYSLDLEFDEVYSPHFESKIQQLVECCQNQLSTDDYKMVCVSILESKNSTQIGEEFNLKPNTVRQKLKRCFAKLKQECVELWIDLKMNNQNNQLTINN